MQIQFGFCRPARCVQESVAVAAFSFKQVKLNKYAPLVCSPVRAGQALTSRQACSSSQAHTKILSASEISFVPYIKNLPFRVAAFACTKYSSSCLCSACSVFDYDYIYVCVVIKITLTIAITIRPGRRENFESQKRRGLVMN